MSKQVDGPTQVMDEGLLLGYNEFRGVKKPIRLGIKDRRRHVHIIGQTGVGKSVLQENLAYQDMMDGRGFAFVDPHGDSVEALLSKIPKERVEDVVYFNPSDMSRVGNREDLNRDRRQPRALLHVFYLALADFDFLVDVGDFVIDGKRVFDRFRRFHDLFQLGFLRFKAFQARFLIDK